MTYKIMQCAHVHFSDMHFHAFNSQHITYLLAAADELHNLKVWLSDVQWQGC